MFRNNKPNEQNNHLISQIDFTQTAYLKKNYPVIDQPIDIERFVNDMKPNYLTVFDN
jgi:hypothetical protein